MPSGRSLRKNQLILGATKMKQYWITFCGSQKIIYFKRKRSTHSELSLGKFESFNINKIKQLASDLSKSLSEELSNTTLTFTFGKWALPYLKFFKE